MLAGFKNSKMYPKLQKALRVLQFLSAVTSLIVFSIRIYKLSKLTEQLSTANGAVEGIVAAAVAYTLGVMVITFLIKGRHSSNILRWFLVIMDLAFVGAFIAVSVLTSPTGRYAKAGSCRNQLGGDRERGGAAGDAGCKLPLGTFVTAIVSTLLHTLTAVFHNVRDKHHDHVVVEKEHNHGAMGRDSTTLHGGRESTTVPVANHNHGHNASNAV